MRCCATTSPSRADTTNSPTSCGRCCAALAASAVSPSTVRCRSRLPAAALQPAPAGPCPDPAARGHACNAAHLR
ncbi:hypothetical protein G6F64_014533 [Rhizopus arrhizus]|uniref:Uncharacterized protein n=1 Tax=Rhizopus oryzae TaxID=64495 RepID=A0A9P6WTZ2_RHIOR|nr:hypothetical protein G6F64_014533 [Rhizopus arrhizus]